MKCILCNHETTKVTDSRLNPEQNSTRRRRECTKCNFRFSTLEEAVILDLVVVKHDGKREIYKRGKIVKGLEKALEKRPYTGEDLQKLITSIEIDIQKKKKTEMEAKEIGQIIVRKLRRFDPVAYIRFSSVYHSYDDISEFAEELEKLTKKRKKRTKAK